MAHHAGSLIPRDFQLHTAARIDTHSRCRSRSTTRPSRCSNQRCRKRNSAVMKNWGRCGGWTSNPESLNGTQTVPPSRTSLRKSLIARIPTVGVPFSAGSRHQEILPIESAPQRNCRADSADGTRRCAISILTKGQAAIIALGRAMRDRTGTIANAPAAPLTGSPFRPGPSHAGHCRRPWRPQ